MERLPNSVFLQFAGVLQRNKEAPGADVRGLYATMYATQPDKASSIAIAVCSPIGGIQCEYRSNVSLMDWCPSSF
jgi:hypothetical protein